MSKFWTYFRITPFKLSLLIITAFVYASFLYDVKPESSGIITVIDEKSLDLKFNIRGEVQKKNKIVIVAGDEKSFQSFGQWPWDRGKVFAPLLDRLCRYNTKVIGLDMVWSEPEKRIPEYLLDAIHAELKKGTDLNAIIDQNSGDHLLNKAITACNKKIVLGYALTTNESMGQGQEEYLKRIKLVSSSGSNQINSIVRGSIVYPNYTGDPKANVSFQYVAKTGILNLPSITPEGVAQGFFNNDSDNDGNYRKAYIFYKTDVGFLSSLVLRMGQKILHREDIPPVLSIQPNDPDQGKVEDLRLDIKTTSQNYTLPMDLNGKLIINYRGPNFTFPNISISEIMSNKEVIEYTQYVPGEGVKTIKESRTNFFNDALVLIGVTAVALYDIRPRPFDRQASGVENHANILDNLISNDFLVRPTTEMLLILNGALIIFSLLYALVITKSGAKVGALIATVTISLLLYLDQKYMFVRGIVFSSYLQAIQFLFQYIGITLLKYIQEESEKKFIRSAFDKYVSPAVINQMLSDPKRLSLGGEKRELSIMFSDIRGFTELSEKLDVKTLTMLLNEYLGAMTDILQSNEGTLDKYIGDAVMGFWGAPLEVESQATKSIKTAVDMINKLYLLQPLFKEKYGVLIDIGIGINTGEVSVGNFGSAKVLEYTVIGDHVNLASRLEGLNKYYGSKIIVSEFTKDKAADDSNWAMREIDTVKVKGKKKPVKIFEVLPQRKELEAYISSLEAYKSAIALYYERKWKPAREIFNSILKSNPTDQVCKNMLERCDYYAENNPPSDWDGAWEMKSK